MYLYGPVLLTLCVIGNALLPVADFAGEYSLNSFSFDVASPMSAAITGLFSAWLWLKAAVNTNDKLSNAGAAGCSGATAAFGSGGIDIKSHMPFAPESIVNHWSLGSYLFGWLILLAVFVGVWIEFNSNRGTR